MKRRELRWRGSGHAQYFPSETRLKESGVQCSWRASGKDQAVDPQGELQIATRSQSAGTDLLARTNPLSAHWR